MTPQELRRAIARYQKVSFSDNAFVWLLLLAFDEETPDEDLQNIYDLIQSSLDGQSKVLPTAEEKQAFREWLEREEIICKQLREEKYDDADGT